MRSDFAIFILTHGRADNLVTLNALKNSNYNGKIYYILDNEDDTIDKYKKLYGKENIIVFDKQKVYEETDTMDTTGEKRAIIFARNISYDLAKNLGLKYFLMLDDDYTSIGFRYADGTSLRQKKCTDFNKVIDSFIKFLENTNTQTICMAQNGDFMGGTNSTMYKNKITRKAMNSFFCRVDRPIKFKGTMNEDVTTYTTLGSQGVLFFTYYRPSINQKQTQSTDGGMTEVYRNGGTYIKTFYSVMSMPSCIKVSILNSKHSRIHHKVLWNNCVPKIINERWKKYEC